VCCAEYFPLLHRCSAAFLVNSFVVERVFVRITKKAMHQSVPLASDQAGQINGWVLSDNIVDPRELNCISYRRNCLSDVRAADNTR